MRNKNKYTLLIVLVIIIFLIYIIITTVRPNDKNHLVILNQTKVNLKNVTVTYSYKNFYWKHNFLMLKTNELKIENLDFMFARPAQISIFFDGKQKKVNVSSIGRYGHTIVLVLKDNSKIGVYWDAFKDGSAKIIK